MLLGRVGGLVQCGPDGRRRGGCMGGLDMAGAVVVQGAGEGVRLVLCASCVLFSYQH